jgi:hypothetical protein
MVLLQASRLLDTSAHAAMVVNKDAVTMITTPAPAGGELLYILDSRSGRLFAYTLNVNKQIDLMAQMDIGQEFGAAAADATLPPVVSGLHDEDWA